jgi:hypothetical protein
MTATPLCDVLAYISSMEDEVNFLEDEILYFVEKNNCKEALEIIDRIKTELQTARTLRRFVAKYKSRVQKYINNLKFLNVGQDHLDKIQTLLDADSYMTYIYKMNVSRQNFITRYNQYLNFVNETIIPNRRILYRMRKLEE